MPDEGEENGEEKNPDLRDFLSSLFSFWSWHEELAAGFNGPSLWFELEKLFSFISDVGLVSAPLR